MENDPTIIFGEGALFIDARPREGESTEDFTKRIKEYLAQYAKDNPDCGWSVG